VAGLLARIWWTMQVCTQARGKEPRAKPVLLIAEVSGAPRRAPS
jgi:hypothetical protein